MAYTSSISEMKAEVGRLVAETALVVGRLEPRDLPASGVPALLDGFIELERRAAAGRLLLAARAAESNKWKRQGFRSAAEWFAAQSGTSTGCAREDLATSERLEGLEGTSGAVREGRLSPEQAAAISDAAAVNPAAEAGLLDLAETESLKGLKDQAAEAKAEVEDLEERDKRIRKNRRCRTWVGRDGAWNLTATGPIAEGSGFEVAWERLIEERFTDARLAGTRESRENYAFDALMNMANQQAGAKTEGKARENLRHLALIRVDLDALTTGDVGDDGLCEIAGLGPIPISVARRMLGDSILKLVVTKGVDVLNVTHLGRGATTAQTIALLWQQPNCSVAGCNRTRRLQHDHRTAWATERVTRLANLDPLCEHHHNLKTRDGWALVAGTGRRPMVAPDHPDHPLGTARATARPAEARAGP
jgi:hypothetical protein